MFSDTFTEKEIKSYSFFANKDYSFLNEFNTSEISSELCQREIEFPLSLKKHKYSLLAVDKEIKAIASYKIGDISIHEKYLDDLENTVEYNDEKRIVINFLYQINCLIIQ